MYTLRVCRGLLKRSGATREKAIFTMCLQKVLFRVQCYFTHPNVNMQRLSNRIHNNSICIQPVCWFSVITQQFYGFTSTSSMQVSVSSRFVGDREEKHGLWMCHILCTSKQNHMPNLNIYTVWMTAYNTVAYIRLFHNSKLLSFVSTILMPVMTVPHYYQIISLQIGLGRVQMYYPAITRPFPVPAAGLKR